jgi:hypothetical protein
MARATHVYNIAGYCKERNSFLCLIYAEPQHSRGFLPGRGTEMGILPGAIARRVQ